MSNDKPDLTEFGSHEMYRSESIRTPEEARIRKLEERMNDMVHVADLRELIEEWRERIDDVKEPSVVLEDTTVITDDGLAGAARVIRDLEELIDDE